MNHSHSSFYFSDNYLYSTKSNLNESMEVDICLHPFLLWKKESKINQYGGDTIASYIKGKEEDVVYAFFFLNNFSNKVGNMSRVDSAEFWKCPINTITENNTTIISGKTISDHLQSFIDKYQLTYSMVVVPYVHKEEFKKYNPYVTSNIEAFIRIKNINENSIFYVIDEYDMYRVDYKNKILSCTAMTCGNIMAMVSCICCDIIVKLNDKLYETGIRNNSIEYKKVCKRLYFSVLRKLVLANTTNMNLDRLFGTQDLEFGIKKDNKMITYKLDCNSANEICKSWIDKFIKDMKLYISKDMGDSDTKYYIIGDFAHLLYNAQKEFKGNGEVEAKSVELFSQGGLVLFKEIRGSVKIDSKLLQSRLQVSNIGESMTY